MPAEFLVDRPQPADLLQKHFGYRDFRPLQQEVIDHVLAGRDAVVLMPTGGGKSLCYQVPALALDGLTLVISPLIALMKDQVQALQANGIAAAYLNSSLSPEEERSVKQQLAEGSLKLLYVSPETVLGPSFFHTLPHLPLSLIAIDEAHCVSSWGHHFRPEYGQLHLLKEQFPEVPVIALTATADKAVRHDIGRLLGLREPRMFIASFDRPNLSLAVLPGQKRWEQLRRIALRHAGACGIIYCGSRRSTEELAGKLRDVGVNAAHYHAGMEAADRSRTQDDFIQGKVHVVCATIAFGMGIDKGDVRYVVHYNMPGTLEGYYQEIGRAGRDGAPAETILFYSFRDVQTQLGFIEEIDNVVYRDVQRAKLQRMQEYAESPICRRRVLLSYFGEDLAEDCGNCDVCKDPPSWSDGTVAAQMALSAVYRAKQRIGVSTLIDVLKGTRSAPVTEAGLDALKTFGAGRATSAFAWQLFLQQFVQQGLLEIDYTDHYHLKLTKAAQEVLFEGRTVRLVSPETIKERQAQLKQAPAAPKPAAEVGAGRQGLFDVLRELRRTLAAEINKPAYVVFSDATLTDMAARMPLSEGEFLEVHGVGEHKAKRYAKPFLAAIQRWVAEQGAR